MTGWIPDLMDVVMYKLGRLEDKRRELGMEQTDPNTLQEAIAIYRERYNEDKHKTFNMFKLEEVITELKEAKQSKKKKGKK